MPNLMFLRILPFIGALICMLLAIVFAAMVGKKNRGTPRMVEISNAIFVGSRAYLNQQARIMAIFFIVLEILFGIMVIFGYLQWPSLPAFATGMGFSLLIGYIGMWISTTSNSRVTYAAQKKGLGEAMNIAFTAAAASGLLLGTVALFDTAFWFNILYWFYNRSIPDPALAMENVVNILITFTIGASFAAFFMRTGGGIFTKAADMGADYVGKVESGLAEDDYRNPATIADNVGDNVGDVGGMKADSLESWVGAIIATEFLGFLAFKGSQLMVNSIILPMIISTAGAIASILAIFIIKLIVSRYRENATVSKLTATTLAGLLITVLAIVILSYFTVRYILGPDYNFLFWSSLGGVLAGFLIGLFTLIYTDSRYRPTRNISESAKSGPATLVVNGLAYGMESTLLPALTVIGVMLFSFYISRGSSDIKMGLYGVSLSAVSMLAVTPFAITIDVYGPIADNSGGIASMTELPPEVRRTTDKLDAVGNTTAAIGKGLLIGSAAITALALGQSYFSKIELLNLQVLLDFMKDPKILAGLFTGVMLPFLFTSLLIGAVGRAADKVVVEARRQIKDIMSGKSKGDPKTFITIVTRAAQRGIIAPGIMIFAIPVIVGILLGPGGVVALIIGTLLSGFAQAIFMANAGGAMDNAKKKIEEEGRSNTPEHAASVIGDTVGDPLKDTAGPSMNILIKLISVVAIETAVLVTDLSGRLFHF
ncbi:MAG: putative K(+)-stimulated pyrophosphate-energized sodium pump [Actinobacteria bacterium ADurb.Bin346]|nr:MAG: putative K(+)-stimulated pyrophosphate-energized sodium pump [Actinobacteria bacterium ADurb.Bin346]